VTPYINRESKKWKALCLHVQEILRITEGRRPGSRQRSSRTRRNPPTRNRGTLAIWSVDSPPEIRRLAADAKGVRIAGCGECPLEELRHWSLLPLETFVCLWRSAVGAPHRRACTNDDYEEFATLRDGRPVVRADSSR
jgi:hypothetical protein